MDTEFIESMYVITIPMHHLPTGAVIGSIVVGAFTSWEKAETYLENHYGDLNRRTAALYGKDSHLLASIHLTVIDPE